MSFTTTVENGVIKVPKEIVLPDGTEVEVAVTSRPVEGSPNDTLFEALSDLIGKAEGLPEDFAAEHDHYLHGTPKRAGL
jgi:predicted DNA-binding antitoxin AbrB/MazE fold protein